MGRRSLMAFTWIPFYKELAAKLLDYRDRQAELLTILSDLKDSGAKVSSLVDKDKNGKEVPLAAMDPFTFFATFNRRSSDENRQAILAAIKTQLHIKADVPTDFDGIPIMDPRKSRFFPFIARRKNDDVAALWDLADAVVRQNPEDVAPTLIDRCLKIVSTSITNLTMGMFWMKPEVYVALDSRNRDLLKHEGIPHAVKDGASYLVFLKETRESIQEPPYEFSQRAYIGQPETKYWVFQANPKRYDIVGALRDGKLDNWTIKTHKGDISKGDRVIIWVTGAEAGCYALCEVTTDLLVSEEDVGDDGYYKQAPAAGPHSYVELRVISNLWNAPITKDKTTSTAALKKLNVGHQGTVFTATAAQYEAMKKLSSDGPNTGAAGPTYWLYAPGPKAKYWEQCWANGEMVVGFDEVDRLDSYASRDDLEAAVKTALKTDKRPSNVSLAGWQFVHDIKPGDIVIPKLGSSAYLGYGIVAGGYEYDSARDGYRNLRKVDWKKKGEWKESKGRTVLKTLTDISPYPDYVARLKKLIGIEETAPKPLVNLPSKNVILYGPPGTGKTYALRTKYMESFTDRQTAQSHAQFGDDLVSAMSWWEVITMVMLDLKTAKVADILNHPLLQARVRRSENRNPRAAVWSHIQMHTKRDCEHVAYSKRYEPLLFEKSDKSVWSIDIEAAHTEVPELAEKLKAYKDYKPTDATVTCRYAFTTFHQSFSYEDFIEGIKPMMGEDMAGDLAYEIQPGIFRQIALRAKNDPTNPYALFIDEINRGNVASIFGELITLLEDDKRLGEERELTAVLPYSRDVFGVPSNLYVVGTMNTADRSVEALDTALRRRFTFVECAPEPGLLSSEQPNDLKVDLEKLLTTINARIERLLDSDHCIGHSYFMGLSLANDPFLALRQVFANKVLPLLQEYFYGDPGRIGMVLGESFVQRRKEAASLAAGDWGIDGIDERDVFQFADPMELPVEAFVSIYA